MSDKLATRRTWHHLLSSVRLLTAVSSLLGLLHASIPSTRTVMTRLAFSQAAPVGSGMIYRLRFVIMWHLIVSDPLYTLITIDFLLAIALYILITWQFRSNNSPFTRRHNGASTTIFNNTNNNVIYSFSKRWTHFQVKCELLDKKW